MIGHCYHQLVAFLGNPFGLETNLYELLARPHVFSSRNLLEGELKVQPLDGDVAQQLCDCAGWLELPTDREQPGA